MLPNENIEQIRKAKSEKENRKDRLKIRIGFVAAASGIVVMVFLLFLVWFINEDNSLKLAFFDKPDKSESSSLSDKNESADISFSDDLLLIVNSSSKLPDDYDPIIKEYGEIKISEKAYSYLVKMIEDAKSEGFSLKLSSGYIDLSQQEKIYETMYDKYIAMGYSPVKAQNEAAIYKSGYCEQNTALSIMFDEENSFVSSGAYTWLLENCVNYGFVQRYPENKERQTGVKAEPNLFRFVGQENALNMRKFGMCLEEYSEYIAQR